MDMTTDPLLVSDPSAPSQTAKGYVAGGNEYFYPEDGDKPPPGGAQVHLLTTGGVCVRGSWSMDGRYLGWAPLPRRNQEREERIMQRRRMPVG